MRSPGPKMMLAAVLSVLAGCQPAGPEPVRNARSADAFRKAVAAFLGFGE